MYQMTFTEQELLLMEDLLWYAANHLESDDPAAEQAGQAVMHDLLMKLSQMHPEPECEVWPALREAGLRVH